MNHLNVVVEGFDANVAHFRELYGAQFLYDLPRDEWHAGFIAIGGVIFELIAPHDDFLHMRFGPYYLGIEYQVPNLDEARRAVQARGMRIVRERPGGYFHTHPADGFGIAFEFYEGSFHDEPYPVPYLEPIKPIGYWRDEHPLGCLGLKRYGVAVSDIGAARDFFQDLTNATVLYEMQCPTVGAQAVGLGLADTVMELLTPIHKGPVEAHLARYGDGIRSCVFRVKDLPVAESYLRQGGIELHDGDAPGSLAVAPADNCGLLFEFSE
jgi:hypothetical protein